MFVVLSEKRLLQIVEMQATLRKYRNFTLFSGVEIL